MPFLKGENPHRPAPGSVLKVEPIRDKRAIGRIKKMLRDHPSFFPARWWSRGFRVSFKSSPKVN